MQKASSAVALIQRYLVIALDILQQISSLQVNELTDISVMLQMAIMLRFFGNKVDVFAVSLLLKAYSEQQRRLFIFKHFQLPLTSSYSNLVGLGTNGANVMLRWHTFKITS